MSTADTVTLAHVIRVTGVKPEPPDPEQESRAFLVPGAAYTLVWREGKVHVHKTGRLSGPHAAAVFKALAGCSFSNRFHKGPGGPHPYIAVHS